MDAFVARLLKSYHWPTEFSAKIIHDALWGTNKYEAWEVAIIDSLLMQRLRQIHQTGLAYLVYPTARHSRFEHSLGTTVVVARIAESINDRLTHAQPIIGALDLQELRLAALLHDVGHCFLSHVSECVYGEMQQFDELIRYINAKFGVKPKPHEILSYLVVTSESFGTFLRHVYLACGLVEPLPDADVIGGYIIGYSSTPKKKFLADLINGAIDADKLDYLARDARFSGASIIYDIERYMQTVIPWDNGSGLVRAHLPLSGVSALEQIIISKMMLHSCVYQHHKVRSAEAAAQRACRRGADGHGMGLQHPCEFLNRTDYGLLQIGEPQGSACLCEIAQRSLLKRALIISRLFVPGVKDRSDDVACDNFDRLMAEGQSVDGAAELSDAIFRRMCSYLSPDEAAHLPRDVVLLDVPKVVKVEEAVASLIPITPEGPDTVELDRILPVGKWAEGYATIQWRGHVFAAEGCRNAANRAAQEILWEKYSLKFENEATLLCKLPTTDDIASLLQPQGEMDRG